VVGGLFVQLDTEVSREDAGKWATLACGSFGDNDSNYHPGRRSVVARVSRIFE